MFLEKHRNALALGAVALVSVVLLAVLFAPLLSPSASSGPSVTELGATEMLEDGKVIPDVLDVFRPQLQLTLSLGSRPLLDGSNLPLQAAQESPSAQLQPLESAAPGPSSSGKYVLVMVDPDAPSPSNPTAREWLHWIVAGVELSTDVTPQTPSVVEYNRPTPPEGEHRYVVVAYAQPSDMPEISAPQERANFNVRSFAKEYSLGDPLAAIYFTTKPDA